MKKITTWCFGRRLVTLREADEFGLFGAASVDADGPLQQPPRGLAESPFDAASCASFCDFSFVDTLLRRGAQHPIRAQDLDALAKHDHVAGLVAELHKNWTRELETATINGKQPSLWRAIYRSHRFVFWYAGFWCLAESVLRIVQPVILGSFIGWMVDPSKFRLSASWTVQFDDGMSGARSAGRYLIGAFWVVLLLLAALAQIAVHHQLYFYTMRAGWNIRLATTGLIHRKLMTLSAATLSGPGSDVAQIVNLASNDANRFDRFIPALHFAWSGVFDLLVIFALLVLEVGPLAAIAAVAIVLLLIPVQLILGRRFGKQRRVTAGLTDERMRVVKEVFASIDAVKSFGWEFDFGKKVSAIRARERASICVSQALKSFNLAAYFATPYISTFATFSLLWAMGQTLEVTEVFAAIALVHVLRIGMGKNLSRVLEAGPECAISVQRIRNFLMLPSAFPDVYASSDGVTAAAAAAADTGSGGERDTHAVLLVDGADFTWRSHSTGSDGDDELSAASAALTGISLKLKRGEMCVVWGATGSGKSTLLSSILGELVCTAGTIVLRVSDVGGTSVNTRPTAKSFGGAVSVSMQQAWIMAGTVRMNICFGRPFEGEWYARVTKACALDADFDQLPEGDRTYIGDDGVNLSGGQKARVSLARSVYARPSLALLDDTLSAVDPLVGRTLLNECIVALLLTECNAAVLLATHNRDALPLATTTLVLSQGGEQIACAPYDELRHLLDGGGDNGSLADTAQEEAVVEEEDEKETEEEEEAPAIAVLDTTADPGGDVVAEVAGAADAPLPNTTSNDNSPAAAPGSAKLVSKEESVVGSVTCKTYWFYFLMGGIFPSFVVAVLFLAAQTAVIFADWWLNVWASVDAAEQRNPLYISIFAALTLVGSALAFAQAAIFFVVSLRAASRLHDRAFASITRAPLSFFAANPLGRILNKCE
tara:strand:+ start:427 stop:3246 length:2820 start_codon:yes stop_codon:yes gene_type:complete